MKMRLILFLLSFFLLNSYCYGDGAQQQVFTSASSGVSVNEIGGGISYHKITWNITGGTLSACTVAVDTSTDNISWSAGGAIAGQSCTSNGASSVTGIVNANYVRMTVTTFTSSSGVPSLTVLYNAYINSPSAGGLPAGVTSPGTGSLTGTGVFQAALVDKGGEVYNVLTYGASGSAQHTTNSGTTGVGSSILMTSAIDFKDGQGLYLIGAGPHGGPYFGHITSGGGTSLINISPATSTSVGTGQELGHADSYGSNLAQDACETAGGGIVYFPAGTYRMVDAPLHSHHLTGSCWWIGASSTGVIFTQTFGNGPGSEGPQAVMVGTLAGYMDPAFIQFGTALLTGTGSSYSPNGNNEQWLNLRDSASAGDYNNTTAFTVEGTIKVTTNPGANTSANIITSGGQNTSDDPYNSAFTVTLKNVAGTTTAFGSMCLSKQQNGTVTPITAWSITTNVATFTAVNSLTTGQKVRLGQFGAASFFNEQVVTVIATGLSGTQFEANFTHANGSGTESAHGEATCTQSTVTATTAVTTAVNHHVALTYDGSNVKLWYAGNSEGTPQACSSCYLGQDTFENVQLGAAATGFLEGSPDSSSTWAAINGSIDAVRVSNTARYTVNFTPPTAKWSYPADSNTYVQINFDNQQDVFTVAETGRTGNGNPVESVWLPIHRTDACGAGFQENLVSGIKFGAMDGLYISGAPDNQFTDWQVSSNHNGQLFGQCTYNTKMDNGNFVSTSGRYNLMSANGLTDANLLKGGGSVQPFTFGTPNGTYRNLFVQVTSGTRIPVLWGSAKLPGGNPVIDGFATDCEASSSVFRTVAMFDSLDGASVNGGIFDSSCITPNTPPITIHSINSSSLGGSSIAFHSVGMKTTTGETALAHFTGVNPTTNPTFEDVIQYSAAIKNLGDCTACIVPINTQNNGVTDTSIAGTLPPNIFNDATDFIGIHRTTNAQKLSVYGTFTDTSNYTRFGLDMTSNNGRATLRSESAGTGLLRDLWLISDQGITFYATGSSIGINYGNGTASWNMQSGITNNPFFPNNDATLDFGIASTNRIKNGYFSSLLSAARFKPDQGTASVSGKFVLSGGWGTTASQASLKGGDQASCTTITSSGTGQAANPTITWTFSDGTWTNAPIVYAWQQSGTGNIADIQNTTESATAPVFTYVGTPVAASTYRICFSVTGSQN